MQKEQSLRKRKTTVVRARADLKAKAALRGLGETVPAVGLLVLQVVAALQDYQVQEVSVAWVDWVLRLPSDFWLQDTTKDSHRTRLGNPTPTIRVESRSVQGISAL
jgi:hypothetical protein